MNGDFATTLHRRAVPLLFGVTPPRASVTREQVEQIAQATLARLDGMTLDGLVLYDLDDESDRTEEVRPFPYLPTMDPADFLTRGLAGWGGPVIVYRSVGKYCEQEFTAWLDAVPPGQATVLVGASSSNKQVKLRLPDALRICRSRRPDVPVGAVAIPERHTAKENEHERILEKQHAGASFFVSQVIYDASAAKSLASDYTYGCQDRGLTPARIFFTLSLCGSLKTLSFLEWLGVEVPRWLRNELTHARDPLGLSVVHALDTARELRAFCDHLGLPCGFNVESVSNRRVEIEAAVHVARQLAFETGR
ncbi:MAG: 5,10-methylenetetrahydrofolate reductase [Tetrasphaera sp.]